MTHPTARAITTARILLMTIEHRIEATEAALLAGADDGEGFPARGGTGRSDAELDVPEDLRGGPTTPTEALALRRTVTARDLGEFRRAAAEVVRTVNRLEALVRSHSGEPVTREFVERLRCANATKLCRNIADPQRDDRLCVEHGSEVDRADREQRHRRMTAEQNRRLRRHGAA